MNRWLYRAAGTVGLAGGFLLLATSSAQAGQAGELTALDDALSPTSGLPPLNLPAVAGGQPAAAATPGSLALNPADGRHGPAIGDPELLPGLPLPGLPLPGLPALPGLDGLPGVPGLEPLTDGVPLDGLGLPDGRLGTGVPLDGIVDLAGEQLGVPGAGPDLQHGPTQLPDHQRGPRTLPASAGPLPAADQTTGMPVEGGPAPELLGPLPPLPVAGADPLGLGELATAELPALIGDELAVQYGLDRPAELTGAVPLIGPALDPVGQLVGLGNLPAQVPLVGPMVGPMLGDLPVMTDPAQLAPAEQLGTAGGRPIAGEDPEFG